MAGRGSAVLRRRARLDNTMLSALFDIDDGYLVGTVAGSGQYGTRSGGYVSGVDPSTGVAPVVSNGYWTGVAA